MARSAEKKRPLYLDVHDATEALGITPRQLRYWEESDLLKPELGRNRYTEQDLARLRVIKRLVVDEGFPVDVVRKLFERQLWDGEHFDDVTHDRVRSGDLTNLVLDLDSGSLVQRDEMFERLWHEFLAKAEERNLETHLEQLILLYFRQILRQSRTTARYVGHVEELRSRVEELSRVARLEPVYADDDKGPGPITGIRLHPLLPGETDESEDPDALFARNESALIDLAKARSDLTLRGRYAGLERLGDFSDYIDLRL
jgi:DNA-binding transcriptional MerR regulator